MAKTLGRALGKEAAMARMRVLYLDHTENPNLDTLPVEVWREILAAKGERSWASISAALGRPRTHNWHVGRRAPTRRTVAVLSEAVGAPGLAAMARSDVLWDAVISIEADGVDQVYDLTVPELHNFVAADVLVHNTAFALGAAANVAMSARRPVMFFSMTAREFGQVESVCGKSEPHMTASAPMLDSAAAPTTSSMNVSHTCRRT